MAAVLIVRARRGIHAAGYELVAGVEIDPHAAATYGRNRHGGSPLHSKARDLTRTSPEELARELDLGDPADAVDVVVGGPPCQAFARIGRAKLREVARHPEAFLHDPCADLHGRWLAWITAFRPLAVLVENVPDMLNFRGRNLAEEIAAELGEMDFVGRYALLNAVHYGVPQIRERMFLLAVNHYRQRKPTSVSYSTWSRENHNPNISKFPAHLPHAGFLQLNPYSVLVARI